MSDKREKIEKVRQEAARKNGLYLKIFSTPDGKELLKDLEELFYNGTSIVPGDPYATHAREGAREVVIYIKQNIEGAKHVD